MYANDMYIAMMITTGGTNYSGKQPCAVVAHADVIGTNGSHGFPIV